MHLGLSITPFGHHAAAWRQGKSADALRFEHLAAQVKKAEEGGFDFAFFADRLGRRPVDDLDPDTVPFEPTTLVAALATVTKNIGLIATASMAEYEPYNLARRFASLDTISGGRGGWNFVTAEKASSREEEYVDVVNGLWDSFEEDAFVYDKEKGRFFVPGKMHVLNHRGKHFTVRGPLNVNRSPQGKPVIAHVLKEATLDIAARTADLVFIDARSPDEARTRAADFTERLRHHQRTRSDVRVVANVIAYAGATNTDARMLRERLDRGTFAGPLPAGLEVVGNPCEIADRLQTWSETAQVDGFTILPPLVPESVDAFVDGAIGELRARGLVRKSHEGTTLREHLSLRTPPHAAEPAAGALGK